MALVQKSFEKGPAGSAYAIADDGALLKTVAGNGPITYELTAKAHGTYGLKFARATGACLVRYSTNSTRVLSGSVVFSSNGIGVQVLNVTTDTDVVVFKIEYRPDTGYIAVVSATGVAYPLSTSASNSTLGTKYRVAFNFTISSTTATAGVINARLYDTSNTQLGNTVAVTTANLGTAAVSRVNIGNANNTAAATVVEIDDLQWDDATATLIGPMSDPTTPVGSRPIVAVLGDSKANQSGTGVTAIPAAFARQGWQTSQITVSGVSSRVPWAGTVTPTTETTWNQWMSEGLDPKYVVLILGGNIRTSSQSTWQFQFNELFKMIDDGTRQIFCMNLVYQDSTDGVSFNNWYKTFIDANPRAHLIDQYTMIRNRESAGQPVTWNADGVHMNPGTTGYDLINDLATSTVLSYYNSTTTNPAPVVTNIATQSVPANTAVTVSATATGTVTSWAWRQISGPTVTLSGTGATRSFSAPAQATASTIVLGVTAINNGVSSVEKTATIEVSALGSGSDASVFGKIMFEGGVDGVSLTLANSGATPQAATSPNTATFSATAKAYGNLGGRWERSAGGNVAGCFSRYAFPASTSTFQMDGVFTAEAVPSASKQLANLRSGGSRMLALTRDSNVGYYMLDRANTGLQLIAPGSIVTGKKYRFVLWGTVGTATTGQYSARLYDFDTQALVGQRNVTNADLGTAPLDAADFGSINDLNSVTMWDALRFGSSAAELPEYVYAPDPPVIGTIAAKTVESLTTTSVTASSASTVTTWTWRQISGPTVTLTGTGATRSFVTPADPAGATVVLGVTASNPDGTSSEQTATVNVLAHQRFFILSNGSMVGTTTTFL